MSSAVLHGICVVGDEYLQVAASRAVALRGLHFKTDCFLNFFYLTLLPGVGQHRCDVEYGSKRSVLPLFTFKEAPLQSLSHLRDGTYA